MTGFDASQRWNRSHGKMTKTQGARSKLHKIMDLVGVKVSGLVIDIRTRQADGSLMYDHQEKDGPRLRELQSVEIRTMRGHSWLYWTWKPDTRMMGDCGYSGVRLDNNQIDTYHLAIDLPAVCLDQDKGAE